MSLIACEEQLWATLCLITPQHPGGERERERERGRGRGREGERERERERGRAGD